MVIIQPNLPNAPIKRLILDSLDVSKFKFKKVIEGYRLTAEIENVTSDISCLLEGPIDDEECVIVSLWERGDPYDGGKYIDIFTIKGIEEARKAVIEGFFTQITTYKEVARAQGYETPEIVDNTGKLEGLAQTIDGVLPFGVS